MKFKFCHSKTIKPKAKQPHAAEAVVHPGKFYPQQDYEQVNFYKKSRLYINSWSLRDGEVTIFLQLAQNWNAQSKICQNSPLISTFAVNLQCYAEKN